MYLLECIFIEWYLQLSDDHYFSEWQNMTEKLLWKRGYQKEDVARNFFHTFSYAKLLPARDGPQRGHFTTCYSNRSVLEKFGTKRAQLWTFTKSFKCPGRKKENKLSNRRSRNYCKFSKEIGFKDDFAARLFDKYHKQIVCFMLSSQKSFQREKIAPAMLFEQPWYDCGQG